MPFSVQLFEPKPGVHLEKMESVYIYIYLYILDTFQALVEKLHQTLHEKLQM